MTEHLKSALCEFSLQQKTNGTVWTAVLNTNTGIEIV